MTGDTDRLLARIADALDRLAPTPPPVATLADADAFLWHGYAGSLAPVPTVAAVDIALLQGIDRQRDLVLANTRRFAAGRPVNNVMLWGARGMGKSSLVKAAHATVNAERPHALALIEIARDELSTLPRLLGVLRRSPRRFVVFCDDLSFDRDEAGYKALKSVLDGGIEGRPANVLFVATSNRRHLMARDMIDNERATAINPGEAVEEKVSLSDRFGLSLGFHTCDQETFFAMVDAYAAAHRLAVEPDDLHRRANAWSIGRGARSGRVAVQFIDDLAAELAEDQQR